MQSDVAQSSEGNGLELSQQCTVYYNSACPVCRAGVENQQQRIGPNAAVSWVDVHAQPEVAAQLGIPLEQIRERLHVQDGNGQLAVGIDAFARIAEATTGQRFWAWLLRLPGLHWLATKSYNGFARYLYRWNRRQGHW